MLNWELKKKKKRRCVGSPGGVRGQAGSSRRTLGYLTKTVKVGFFQLWPCFSLTVCCTHMNPAAPSELRRTLGFLTKKPCILLEDRMRPQPFVSLGAASNFCLKQTSTLRQNKSLDPINYRVYQISGSGFHLVVMLNYTLLALPTLVLLFVRSLHGCAIQCIFCCLAIANRPLCRPSRVTRLVHMTQNTIFMNKLRFRSV